MQIHQTGQEQAMNINSLLGGGWRRNIVIIIQLLRHHHSSTQDMLKTKGINGIQH